MKVKSVLIVAVWSGVAFAQDAAMPPPPPPAPVNTTASVDFEQTAKLWLGPQLDLMPSGRFDLAANGTSVSADTSSAFGLGGVLEYRLSQNVALGFAPRFVVPVKVKNASDSGWQVDLRARATGGAQVAPRVHAHGIATLGYSAMMHVLAILDANGMPTRYERASGIVFGFGAGIGYTINPRLTFEGELSYQFGFQGATVENVDVDASDNFLTLGFGLVAAIQ